MDMQRIVVGVGQKLISNFIYNFSNKPKSMIVAIIAVLLLGPSLFNFLNQAYGLFTGIGFVVTLICALTDGRLADNPNRLVAYFVSYAICAIAVNLILNYLFATKSDLLGSILCIIVAIGLWLRGQRLKEE